MLITKIISYTCCVIAINANIYTYRVIIVI